MAGGVCRWCGNEDDVEIGATGRCVRCAPRPLPYDPPLRELVGRGCAWIIGLLIFYFLLSAILGPDLFGKIAEYLRWFGQ